MDGFMDGLCVGSLTFVAWPMSASAVVGVAYRISSFYNFRLSFRSELANPNDVICFIISVTVHAQLATVVFRRDRGKFPYESNLMLQRSSEGDGTLWMKFSFVVWARSFFGLTEPLWGRRPSGGSSVIHNVVSRGRPECVEHSWLAVSDSLAPASRYTPERVRSSHRLIRKLLRFIILRF